GIDRQSSLVGSERLVKLSKGLVRSSCPAMGRRDAGMLGRGAGKDLERPLIVFLIEARLGPPQCGIHFTHCHVRRFSEAVFGAGKVAACFVPTAELKVSRAQLGLYPQGFGHACASLRPIT